MNGPPEAKRRDLRAAHASKFVMIARRFFDAGAAGSALESLALGLELCPGDPVILLSLGDAYSRLDRSEEAREIWRGLLDTQNPAMRVRLRVRPRLARDALSRGAKAEGMDILAEHLREDPTDRTIAAQLLHLQLDEAPPARRHAIAERHFTAFGRDRMGNLLLAIHCGMLEEPEAATALLVAEPARFEGQPDIALAAIDALVGIAAPAAVLAFARTLEGLFAGDGRFVHRLIRAMVAAGADRREIAAAADKIPLGGRRDNLRKLRLLAETRNWAFVVVEAEAMLASGPFDADVAALAIRGYVILERPEDADRLLARCRAALDTGGSDAQIALADLEILARRPEEAASRLASLYRSEPSRVEIRSAFAQASALAGDYRAAWPVFEGLLDETVDALPARRLAARCGAALAIAPEPEARFPDALIEHALRLEPRRRSHTDTLVICTSTLAAGGAERQVALTGANVADRRHTQGGRTVLLGRNFDHRRGHDVMRALAARSPHLEIEDMRSLDATILFRTLCAEPDSDRDALKLIAAFPDDLSGDIVKLYARFLALRPRVVHLWQDGRITLGAIAAILAGVPRIVCSVRNVLPPVTDRRRYRPYLAAVYRALQARPEVVLTANSQAGAADYEAGCGLPPGSIRTLRNGIDVDRIRANAPTEAIAAVRARLGLPAEAPLVGGVFRLAPAKRPDLWIETAARVAQARQDARFVIVGTGVLREQLEQRSAALGLAERLTFAGPQNPVEPWIAAMDAMLLVSEVEGLPNVVLEAQALGVPVAATDAGGTGEAIRDGRTGRLVRTETPDALAAAVVEVIGGAIAAAARTEAPAFIAGRFGVPRMIDETLAAYDG